MVRVVELTVGHVGVPVSVAGHDDDGVVLGLTDTAEAYVRLVGDTVTARGVAAPPAAPPSAGPFTLGPFGANRRLTWTGGGCAVRRRARVAFWGERYAAIVDGQAITIVDGRQGQQARLELPAGAPRLEGEGAVAHGARLVIGADAQVVYGELAALVALLEADEREVDVRVRTVYPLRDAGAAVEAKVAWVLTEADAVINVGPRRLRLVGELGLEPQMTIVLRDELWPGAFAAVDVPGRARQPLHAPLPPREVHARIVRGRTRDPAATGAALAPTERVPELERLLAALAREPDDDATRGVLVDLLQELGEAYGAWVARGRAGGAGPSRAHRRAALGPLAHFIADVAYRGGLPWSAALVRRPPEDPALLAAATADLRLGMLSELRVAKGPLAVYRALIGSPRALGLRRVDAPDGATLAALIAAGREQLTHLHDVRFSKPAAVALLADATFDRVVEIETFVQLAHVDALLARVAADAHRVFARAPRTLVLRARSSYGYDLLPPALRRFPQLPVQALRVEAVAVRREGGRVIARVASTAMPPATWLGPLAEALPDVAVVELPADPATHAAVRRALPHADLRPVG